MTTDFLAAREQRETDRLNALHTLPAVDVDTLDTDDEAEDIAEHERLVVGDYNEIDRELEQARPSGAKPVVNPFVLSASPTTRLEAVKVASRLTTNLDELFTAADAILEYIDPESAA